MQYVEEGKKWKKIFLIFMLMGIMIVSAGILVSAKDEMGMVVNGENANMKISPKVIEGVTMVPFRETMGNFTG